MFGETQGFEGGWSGRSKQQSRRTSEERGGLGGGVQRISGIGGVLGIGSARGSSGVGGNWKGSSWGR